MIIPISDPCESKCEQNLYTSRQVHIRLAQNSDRVERFAVPTTPLSSAFISATQSNHPKLKIIDTQPERVSSWFNETPELNADSDYLLVDQEGRAMMAYNDRIHGNDVLKDIKRALKYSIDYR